MLGLGSGGSGSTSHTGPQAPMDTADAFTNAIRIQQALDKPQPQAAIITPKSKPPKAPVPVTPVAPVYNTIEIQTSGSMMLTELQEFDEENDQAM